MPSLYEQYKYENKIDNVNDLEELKKLYNTTPSYQKEFGFAEFVDIATKDSLYLSIVYLLIIFSYCCYYCF